MKEVYIGCGQNPISGGINLDNSPSVFFARHRFLCRMFSLLGFIREEQLSFMETIREKGIKYGDAKKLPFRGNSVDVLYSCHTLEHMYEEELLAFLNEAYRVLKKGGVLRIVVPDLLYAIEKYNADRDADAFCASLDMGYKKQPDSKTKLSLALFGFRGHKWMYDGNSMKKFIETNTRFHVILLKAGETTIQGNTNINLWEREEGSVYLECRKSHNFMD